jgi:hypothetical protein
MSTFIVKGDIVANPSLKIISEELNSLELQLQLMLQVQFVDADDVQF